MLALVLEAIRDAARLRAVLARAPAADVPVVLLSAGRSAGGRALVSAHSGALAAADGAWEALAAAYGVHRVGDLAELADTLELFCLAAGRCAAPPGTGHRHRARLRPGARPRRRPRRRARRAVRPARRRATTAGWRRCSTRAWTPATRWTCGGPAATPRRCSPSSLAALADDPAVAAVALAVDLVPEFDGDDSYPRAVLAPPRPTTSRSSCWPLPAAIDPDAAARLRAAGVPVLEGTRSGLLALRHLLDHAARPPHRPRPRRRRPDRRPRRSAGPACSPARRGAAAQLATCSATTASPRSAPGRPAARPRALAAAAEIGYPVVLKTDEPGIAHKSDVGGVRLGLARPGALPAPPTTTWPRGSAPACWSARRPRRAPSWPWAWPATPPSARSWSSAPAEFSSRLFAERAVSLPPVTRAQARRTARPAAGRPPAGRRPRPARRRPGRDRGCDPALSRLACDLGDVLDALDVNPLICGPAGALAVDALAVPRQPAP